MKTIACFAAALLCAAVAVAETSAGSGTLQKGIGPMNGRTAVVYFSWSPDGNTRFAAETIAKKASADLFEIKAEKPYNSDFQKCCDEAKPECQGKTLRPIKPIAGLDAAAQVPGATVFHCGTKAADGAVLTDGGRVLSVTGMGATLREAVDTAYRAADKIAFDGSFCRRDIAHRAFERR